MSFIPPSDDEISFTYSDSAPTSRRSTTSVAHVRSSSDDRESATTAREPTGSAARTTGTRLIAVRIVEPPASVVRNSGSYWKCTPALRQPSSAAGLRGVVSSNSVKAPTVDAAREPSCAVG